MIKCWRVKDFIESLTHSYLRINEIYNVPYGRRAGGGRERVCVCERVGSFDTAGALNLRSTYI